MPASAGSSQWTDRRQYYRTVETQHRRFRPAPLRGPHYDDVACLLCCRTAAAVPCGAHGQSLLPTRQRALACHRRLGVGPDHSGPCYLQSPPPFVPRSSPAPSRPSQRRHSAALYLFWAEAAHNQLELLQRIPIWPIC